MERLIATIPLNTDNDILLARQQARQIAALLNFELQDQSRIGAAASELARDLVAYTAGGEIKFLYLTDTTIPVFAIAVSARNQVWFAEILQVLEGETRARSDAGSGFINARRLMDTFRIRKTPAGLPEALFGKAARLSIPISELDQAFEKIQSVPVNNAAEMQQLNQELLAAMEALGKKNEEITRVNLELEETNRGVVALYAELDEKAEQLKTADQLKSRFLSDMSHEFRTPLNSIIGLSNLLLNRVDGNLTAEQEKQVQFILGAAEGLTEMVNDLLDIAKIEAGKTEVYLAEFAVPELLGSLRGMFRPIAANPEVALIFMDGSGLPHLQTDEAKLAQILRNFISNALKFTESGEIRVSAKVEGEDIIFSVLDTGIGIPRELQDLLFREFSQVNNVLQRKIKGTGLGLALCRKLAELLGGSVSVKSAPGKGSTFSVRIPRIHPSAPALDLESISANEPRVLRKVLIVDDDSISRYLVRSWFTNTMFSVLEATDALQGLELALQEAPTVIVLDLNMPGMDGFEFLRNMRSNPLISHIPVVVNTSKILEKKERDFLLACSVPVLSKSDQSRENVLAILRNVLSERERSQG